MTKGIILIALGYDVYGSCAYNMALSLKASDDRIRVCLLYQPKAIERLSEVELSFFDDMIELPESEYPEGQYHRAKLLTYKYSPYDFTIYMDVDSIWIPRRKPSELFDLCGDQDFTIGMNGHYDVIGQRVFSKAPKGYTWWGQPSEMAKYFGIKHAVPQTVSGFYAFKKTDKNKKLFDIALSAYDDDKAPATRWAGGKADEYCFNVAMGVLDMQQDPLEVFYFDKLNGDLEPEEIYGLFWGIAMGGHKVSHKLIILYNKMVNMYSKQFNIESRFYFVNKANVIPDRKTF